MRMSDPTLATENELDREDSNRDRARLKKHAQLAMQTGHTDRRTSGKQIKCGAHSRSPPMLLLYNVCVNCDQQD